MRNQQLPMEFVLMSWWVNDCASGGLDRTQFSVFKTGSVEGREDRNVPRDFLSPKRTTEDILHSHEETLPPCVCNMHSENLKNGVNQQLLFQSQFHFVPTSKNKCPVAKHIEDY